MSIAHRSTGLALLLAAAMAGCSDASGPVEDQVGAVSVTAPQTSVAIDGTVQLAATVLNTSGAVMAGRAMTWSSSAPEIATVTSMGLVRGLSSGPATITASSGTRSGSMQITVLPGACPATPNPAVGLGETRQGSFDVGSCVLDGYLRVVGYRLTLATRTRVRVGLTSSQFDPHLQIRRNDFARAAYAIMGDTARLVMDLDPGTYAIWAASGDARAGGFALRLQQLELVPCTPVADLSFDQTVSGMITGNGCMPPFAPELVAEVWRLNLSAPGLVRVLVSSDAYFPVVMVTNASNVVIGGGVGPAFNIALPAGESRLWVAADMGGTGPYQLTVREAPPACNGTAAGAIALGESRAGTLSADACLLLEGPRAEGWSFTLASRTRVQLNAVSSGFEPILAVTDASLGLRTWTPGSDATHATLSTTLGPGTYILWVGTFTEEVGTYELTVQEVERCPLAGTIAAGQTVNGMLSAGDCLGELRPYAYVDMYRLELPASASLRIDLASVQFDSWLAVVDTLGHVIAENDDGGDGYNSRLVITLGPGVYEVWATSYDGQALGSYQLSVVTVAGGGAAPLFVAPDAAPRTLAPLRPKRN